MSQEVQLDTKSFHDVADFRKTLPQAQDMSLLIRVKRIFSSLLSYLSSFYICKRAYNICVMRETLGILDKGFYDLKRKTIVVDFSYALENTFFHSCKEPEFTNHTRTPSHNTIISVTVADCLDVAKKYTFEGNIPFVLDCGNAQDPCGAYRSGALSLEERITRSSALSFILDKRLGKQKKQFYPINPKIPCSTNAKGKDARTDPTYVEGDNAFRGIYVPKVPVFRKGPNKDYELLKQPFYISVGVIAAWKNPPTELDITERRIIGDYRYITRWRIRSLLNMAYKNNHDTLILGALGCGAFRNPPEDIADLFLQVIKEEYPACFKEIIFAITEDHNPKGNYAVFKARVDAYNESLRSSSTEIDSGNEQELFL